MKPPGTHTNEEVKEALHARARLRTYCISALVVLLLAALAVVYNTAQEYENEEDMLSVPKMVLMVAGDVSFPALMLARSSEKAPFIHQLSSTGGSFGKLEAKFQAQGSALVKLLTGNPESTAITLEGQQSFLRRLKEAGFRPAIVAPPAYFSATSLDSPGSCPRVGIFDTECVGDACPGQNEAAYCNAFLKLSTCESAAQLFANDVVKGFREAAEAGADFILIQVDAIRYDEDFMQRPVSYSLERFSNISLLDSYIGEMALTLSHRTSSTNENWLMALTSEGQNNYLEAPVFVSVYSRGMIARLNSISSSARLTDWYQTILRWFGVTEETDRNIGICSNGLKIKNCA